MFKKPCQVVDFDDFKFHCPYFEVGKELGGPFVICTHELQMKRVDDEDPEREVVSGKTFGVCSCMSCPLGTPAGRNTFLSAQADWSRLIASLDEFHLKPEEDGGLSDNDYLAINVWVNQENARIVDSYDRGNQKKN